MALEKPVAAAQKGSKNAKSSGKKRITPKRPKAHVLRALKKKEPKVVEDAKNVLLLKGMKAGEQSGALLKDLARLVKPHGISMNRKNELLPFDDVTSLEFLLTKNDCALFAFSNHSKKRPQNLTLGRAYDGHVLDMAEFGVTNLRPLESFKGVTKKREGAKPCLFFAGDGWDLDLKWGRIKNLLIDLYRGEDVSKVALSGLDHVASFTLVGDSILIRHYTMQLRKSGTRVPNVQLFEMGPSCTLTLRRHQLASPDLWKTACKQPKQLKVKKVKNESVNAMGDKVGRIHLGRQDLDSMKVRRVKALRKGKGEEGEEGGEGGATDSPVDSADEFDDEEGGEGGSDFEGMEEDDDEDDDDMEE